MLFGLLQEPEEPGMGSAGFGLEEISGEQALFSICQTFQGELPT